MTETKSEEKKPIDVKYDAEMLAAQAQEHINKFRFQMQKIAQECLDEIYVNITPYIETDTWTNYREALRIELEHAYKFSNFKQPWAVDFRRAVFVENREEISRLIESDILVRIKHLEDCRQEFDQFRYSPGGDRYQDILAKHERTLEMLAIAEQCLEGFKLGHEHAPDLPHTRAMGDSYGWCDYCQTKVSWGRGDAEQALEKIAEMKK